MRGVTFPGNRLAEIREFPNPHAGPGEAVLKVGASSLYSTDLYRYCGPDPTDTITGPELCGVIEELGSGAPPGIKMGGQLIRYQHTGCGVCENRTMDYEQLCPQGRVTYCGGTDPF